MEFTEEHYQKIEDMAALNYTFRQIAMYFDIALQEVLNRYANEESQFHYHYERGKLLKSIDVDSELLKKAIEGNLTAISLVKKAEKATRLNNLKSELFGL